MLRKSSKTGGDETGLQRARKIARLIIEKKGADVVIFDLKGISPITDYFVIADGLSEIHNRSIAEHLAETIKPDHVEGKESGSWVLIDYIDIVVHIFLHAARNFYGLERLWGDAKTIIAEDDKD